MTAPVTSGPSARLDMPLGLHLHPLTITCRATEPVLLPVFAGSAVRGALFGAVKDVACANPAAPDCAGCPLHRVCGVSQLLATVDERGPRGREAPRPFALRPPSDGARLVQPGDSFGFGVTLIGAETLRLLPYLVLGLRRMGEAGMGRIVGSGQRATSNEQRATREGQQATSSEQRATREGRGTTGSEQLPRPAQSGREGSVSGQGAASGWPGDDRAEGVGGGGRRGRFVVERMTAVNPFSGERQVVLQAGDPLVTLPDAPVTAEQVARWCAARGEVGRLRLRLRTPLRLIVDGQLVQRLTFDALVRRICRRLTDLAAAYADVDEIDFRALLERAAAVQTVEDHTRWLDLESRSARQGRRLPIGGLIGSITFAGDLTPFLPLLVWGELVGVGKDVTKGNGVIEIALVS